MIGRRERFWTFWGMLAATLVLYLVIVLWSLPIVANDANGLRPFDLRPMGYTTEEARAFLAALGEVGLAQYSGIQHQLDTFYPYTLAITLSLAASLLFSPRWAMLMAVLAAFGAFCDLQENIAVADLLSLGAKGIDEEVVSIASLLTSLKSAVTTGVMLALLFGAGRAIWRRRRA